MCECCLGDSYHKPRHCKRKVTSHVAICDSVGYQTKRKLCDECAEAYLEDEERTLSGNVFGLYAVPWESLGGDCG